MIDLPRLLKLVTSASTVAAIAALSVAGCNFPPKSGPKQFNAERHPVSFTYPNAGWKVVEMDKLRLSGGGEAVGAVALGNDDLIVVRRMARREFPLDEKQFEALLLKATRSKVDVAPATTSAGKALHGNLDWKKGKLKLHTELWFFSDGGGTWQVECQNVQGSKRAVKVREACAKVADTIRFDDHR